MTKGRNTTVIAIRITDIEKDIIKKRSTKRGCTNISDYVKWLLFRPHIKNSKGKGRR